MFSGTSIWNVIRKYIKSKIYERPLYIVTHITKRLVHVYLSIYSYNVAVVLSKLTLDNV